MFSEKSKKMRIIFQAILWFLTLLWLAFCLYLSWQTGEETAGFSQRIARFLLDLLGKLGLQPDALHFHAGLRLFAHFGVFFVTGLLTASALFVSFSRDKRRMAFWIAAISCSLIAVLAEVGKLPIPGRHLTWSETGLNVVGAFVGCTLSNCIYAFAKGKQPPKQEIITKR